ncbi:MAG: UDP-N-acetylglucosamine 2-epimerase (non-hydrolyzing) [Candidatus Eisenbacteria bacterium]|nr:UDP-N-acetylglucosamine 2-epimerase (non-hydrolyzing) [Candidatus Eisenbacteria bacterium]
MTRERVRPESKQVVLVSGARPNLMKIAPVARALRRNSLFAVRLLHTGQHYDDEMAHRFFRDLGLERPDTDLGVGSLSHARQTAAIMERFDEHLDRERADLVIVVGDVNSTIACALTAVKRGILVAHVEAGLRSFDRSMPEEINRILTDAIAHFLFTTERSAGENLRREGIPVERVFFVGNVMVDTLLAHRDRALAEPRVSTRPPGSYALATLHRPSNVDREEDLRQAVDILLEAALRVPVVFPVHPRTRERLERFGLVRSLAAPGGIDLLPPQGYLAFLRLMAEARVVLTDSGGIQEETTALGIPCITLRTTTERPITVEEGTNVVCARDREKIVAALEEAVAGRGKAGRVPEKWDGKAAGRIAAVLDEKLSG